MNNARLRMFARAAVIAALYTVLTLAIPVASYGQIQVRISEALMILPVFTPAAVPGLFVGCVLANALGALLGLTAAWDILFGSVATLLAAAMECTGEQRPCMACRAVQRRDRGRGTKRFLRAAPVGHHGLCGAGRGHFLLCAGLSALQGRAKAR